MTTDKNDAPDVMRAEPWEPLTEVQQHMVEEIKLQGNAMHQMLNTVDGDARCLAVAKTNLEQAVMWAVKGITA